MFQSYFRSGWAFFIPYLAAYLLYAWLKWPVNPATGGEGIVKGISEGVGAASATLSTVSPSTGPASLLPRSLIPSLLYVYWALHAIHLGLAAMALRIWWCAHNSGNRGLSTLSSQLSALWPLAPWLLLALVFYIPGIYLEWPSDPWEHLRRINEWHVLDTVTAHSSWKKSSYFLPYSLTGHTYGLSQLSWLNFYYTGICLLLSWQYYRLARAVGLGERASFVFVLLNALTFGNNIFSFYRYYGLSSSILAQIGAVALTRIALEALGASSAEQGAGSNRQALGNSEQVLTNKEPALGGEKQVLRSKGQTIGHRLPVTDHWSSVTRPSTPLGTLSLPAVSQSNRPKGYSLLRSAAMLLIPCSLLLVFTLFNHIQGLGIAGLGVLAIVVWRLIEWKRKMAFWLAGTAVVLSVATVLWFPRHPTLDEIYRPQGWLTAWYGFNLFSADSPALERSWQILGAVGVANLGLALWLIARKSHVVGWLTLMPVVLLALPCFALPISHALASQTSSEGILVFHRFLFAAPAGLALVAVISHQTVNSQLWAKSYLADAVFNLQFLTRQSAFLLALIGAIILSPSQLSYNRFWQSIQTSPADLQLQHMREFRTPEDSIQIDDNAEILMISTPLASEISSNFLPDRYASSSRLADPSMFVGKLTQQMDLLAAVSQSFDRRATRLNSACADQLRFTRRESIHPTTHTIAKPTTTGSPWIALGGASAQQSLLASHQLSIRNPIGSASYPFSPELIPIARYRRYRVSCIVRQSHAANTTNYLAIAWYDRNANLLASNLPAPMGAGNPAGWSNGTFSYFGLIGGPANTLWTTYAISFGLGEAAAIPAQASFLRIGALLNYQGLETTQVELTAVVLVERAIQRELLLNAPGFWHLHTPASQTALLSGHWSAQYAAIAHIGAAELRRLSLYSPPSSL